MNWTWLATWKGMVGTCGNGKIEHPWASGPSYEGGRATILCDGTAVYGLKCVTTGGRYYKRPTRVVEQCKKLLLGV